MKTMFGRAKRLLVGSMLGACLVASAAAQTLTLNMGHIYSPGNVWYEAAEKYGKAIEERSKGTIKVRISPAASTGDWPQMIEALKIGTNDIVLEGISALDRYNALAAIDSMPYLIRDADHFKAFYYGPLGTEFAEDIAKKTSFRIVGAGYRGARQLTSNKPVRTIADLQNQKIRVPPSKVQRRAWELLGASPTPMGISELFTSMQQGVVDGQENPVDLIDNMKFYEVQKYLMETRHVYAAMTFIFSERKLRSFPPEVQKILLEEGSRIMLETTQNVIAREDATKKRLVQAGMQIIQPDLAPFRARVAPLIKDFPDLEVWYAKIQAVK
jgi:tripartite ATP-independent transporter DctP family solute receptor